MRQLTLFTLLIFSISSFAQETVTFERTKKTEQLFDESNPLSLISILQQNAHYLDYYDLIGMDLEVYKSLSIEEKQSTLKFLGSYSDIPLVDDFGDLVIISLPDGTQSYAYPEPDSLLIDLFGVDKIVFTLNEGLEEPMKRLNKMHLWKQYSSGMHRVLTLDAKAFMRFDGINIVMPLSKKETKMLAGKSKSATLWSTMRDSSLHQMKWFQNRLTNGIYQESSGYAASYVQSFFPYEWTFNFRPNDTWRNSMDEFSYGADFDYNRVHSFSFNLSDSIRDLLIDPTGVKKKFDESHYILTQDMVPLVDEYGDELIKLDELGNYELVYSEPHAEYFFLDYKPVILIANQVECDSTMNCRIIPHQLLFCLNDGGDKPELVSSLSLHFEKDQIDRSYLKPFVSDFKPEEIWSTPEFSWMKEMINNKKFRE